MTLTEFLLARITEDEAVSRGIYDYGDAETTAIGRYYSPDWRDGIEHIAVSRTRWLAECEAKRRIIRLVAMTVGVPTMPAILRVLAAVYADHPSFQEEWKP